MDPQTTLTLALSGDRQAAREYNGWIQNGGFPARVKIHPATDTFMRGVRYADVRRVGSAYVTLTEGNWTGRLAYNNVITEGM